MLAQLARQRGSDFAALARRFSESPVAVRDAVEVFREGNAELGFAARALALGEGQVSDPVQTKYGYYVIERVPLEEYSTAHVLVMYAGVKLAPPGLSRTRAEALTLAQKVAQLAAAPDANFALLASRYSDSPSKVRGGVIAPLRPGRLLEGFEPYLAAVRALADGQVSEVVETPYGLHVIKRLPLRKVLVRHILLGCKECDAQPRTPRGKREAYALALKLLRQLREPGADFAALAREYSDDPSAERGGELQPFARGEMEPRFEQYAFALRVGQRVDLVETRFGYHLIQRLR
ncbi:MAG: peptidylprolyl isomerase [Proteobacteria bacterium]|nr:peptidylprolyl isomerase [Pseudomonadota bacterium]